MEKILLVDDDSEIRSELRELLDGYEVMEAGNGEDALKILRRANEIGLVILDVRMPGISGIDLLVSIKKTDPYIKAIILTGHSSKDVAIEALKSQADDYIEKPVNAGNITDSVEKLISSRRGEDDISCLGLPAKIAKVKRFVESNRYKKVTLKEAAASVCLSQKYLSRIFMEHEKTGFTDYKLMVKIKAAKELLEKQAYNIDQISYKLGYENTESFIRQFKKITGYTPAAYRRRFLCKMKKCRSRKH